MAFFYAGIIFSIHPGNSRKMKTMKMMLALLVVNVGVASAMNITHGVKVLANRMDVMYLKVADDLVGGSLLVYDEYGTKVMELKVNRKRILADFYWMNSGNYVIHIENGGHVAELDYRKAFR